MKQTVASPDRAPERRRLLPGLALAIACLLVAQGVVAFERVTHRELSFTLLADAIGGARRSLAEAIRPDGADRRDDDRMTAAPSELSTSSTAGRPGAAGTPATAMTQSTGQGAPASGPATSSSGRGVPGTLQPRSGPAGAAPASPAATYAAPTDAVTSASGSTSTGRLETTSTTQAVNVSAPPESGPDVDPMVELVRNLAGVATRVRNLELKSTVSVRILAAPEYTARYNQHLNIPSGEAAVQRQDVFRALGIVAPQVDLFGELRRLAGALMPPSFYDATTGELLVQNGRIDAYGRSMLVRTLARALDDQWFGIHRPGLGAATDQAAEGFAALVEGSSRLVSSEYEAALPAGEQEEIKVERARRAGLAPRDISPAVLALYNLPAKTGPPLAAALVQAGGLARLNAAYNSPPTTTEQLITPSKYVKGEAAKAVPAPAADGPVIARGNLGQMNILLMLNGVIVKEQAEEAAKGWDGDEYVVWRSGGQLCVRGTVRMETPDDDTQLSAALSQWAAKRSGAVVSGSGPFTFTRCA